LADQPYGLLDRRLEGLECLAGEYNGINELNILKTMTILLSVL
jgi:hypothetical protein